MTRHGKTPDDPGTRSQADGPQVSPERTEDKDMRELQDPYDSHRLPPRRPEYVIVVDQLRGWQPDAPPSLAEVLETGRPRHPEPDLEAEP
jgi:hypothetical protein